MFSAEFETQLFRFKISFYILSRPMEILILCFRLIWSSYGTSTEMPNYFLPSLIQPNIWYISKKNDFIRSNVKTLQFQALGCSLFSLFLHLLVARDEMIDQRHMIHNLWIIIMSHDRNIIYDCTNIRIPWQCNKLIFEITFFSRLFYHFEVFACAVSDFWAKSFGLIQDSSSLFGIVYFSS